MVKRRLKSVADLKIVVIGDEQTVCGLVLAGAGAVDGQGRKSFFVVDANTRAADTAAYFQEVIKRPDTGIVLITQTAANSGPAIRSALDEFSKAGAACPAVLEIPSKDSEYDAKKDPIMQRVQMFFGSNPVMDMEFAELEEGV